MIEIFKTTDAISVFYMGYNVRLSKLQLKLVNKD